MIEITKLKPRVTEEGTTGMFSSPSDMVDMGMLCRKEKAGKKLFVMDEDELAVLRGNAPIIEKDALRVEVAAVLKHAQALDALISGEKITFDYSCESIDEAGAVHSENAVVSTTGGMAVNVGKSLAETLSEKPLHRNAPNRIGADGGSHENLNGGGNNE